MIQQHAGARDVIITAIMLIPDRADHFFCIGKHRSKYGTGTVNGTRVTN